ncbi:hypothetical protein MF271_16745 [Deinococcus sp. KNUC1210]|uniref:hypothetical protein n=1 Tax=Deinococcus sp. KNUC1210 TaxID=2917691 RepID=UPI001EF15792|nr:hypothetical protein [Deinococcus sp. KNUC1210]ULH15536.1 hypothetical protein MF271_16745 [Deinococcus sp. KNUC1210]
MEVNIGIRVTFSIGSSDGRLSHFLNAPLGAYLVWYTDAVAAFPEDFKPGSVALLQRIVWEGRAGLEAVNAQAPDVVDDLLGWYYGHFTAVSSQAKLTRASGINIGYRHFQALEAMFQQMGQEEASHLLSYLATGRPILGARPVPPV